MYTTKPASSDRKLFKTLDKQLLQEAALYDQSISPPDSGSGIVNTENNVKQIEKNKTKYNNNDPKYLSVSHPARTPSPLVQKLSKSQSRRRRSESSGTASETTTATTSQSKPISPEAAPSGKKNKHPKPKHPKRNSISDAFSAFSTSPGSWRDEESPFGRLDQMSSRRVFAYLVAVLNASDPDHDFSSLQPEDFQREQNTNTVINSFNNALFGVGMPLPPRLWECVNRLIDTSECMTFSFTPPETFLADEPRLIWSMMWFFFNKRKKRVLYLYLKAFRHHQSPELSASAGNGDSLSQAANNDEYDLTTYSGDEEIVGEIEMDL